MVKMKVLAYIIVIALFVTLTACGGDSLTGTWVAERGFSIDGHTGDSSHRETLEFSGQNFIWIRYDYEVLDADGIKMGGSISYYEENDAEIEQLEEFYLNGHRAQAYKLSRRGTYSISDDRIEFLYSDGQITVLYFERTENTLTLSSEQDSVIKIRYIKQ